MHLFVDYDRGIGARMRTMLQGASLVILICLLFCFVITSRCNREPTGVSDTRITKSVLMTIARMHFAYRRTRGITIQNSHDLPKLLEVFKNDEGARLVPMSDWHVVKEFVLNFKDRWGNSLLIERDEAGLLRLYSKGPDGILGTADDLSLQLSDL